LSVYRSSAFQGPITLFDKISLLKVENLTEMNVRSEIITQFTQVAQDHDKRLAPLTDDLELLESGLDSLCFAVVVVRLQEALGIDPFSASEDALFPVTFGEFVKFYEEAA
jgi:acyl carrier protein